MKNISIWYVSKYFTIQSSEHDGSRSYHLMREVCRLGHCVTVFFSNSADQKQTDGKEGDYPVYDLNGFKIYWIRTIKYYSADSFRRVLSWLHFEWRLLWIPKKTIPRPDVIIVSSLSLLTVLTGLWWRFRFKCRLVFEVRDIWPLTITEEGYSRFNPGVFLLQIVEALGYRYSDAIVGTMPRLDLHVYQILGYWKKVYCIPMGISPEKVDNSEPLPSEFESMYIPKGGFIVGYAGSIGRHNELNLFFECAASMQSRSDVYFVVVGQGDLCQKYKNEYAHLSNIRFAPYVKNTMVQSVLRKFDVVFFATSKSRVWLFGQSLNKVIDYMLSGRPIIAVYSGHPSMIDESKCGVFVAHEGALALRQAIEKMTRMKRDDLEAMGAMGRQWLLDNRGYRKLGKDYLNIIQDVLKPQ